MPLTLDCGLLFANNATNLITPNAFKKGIDAVPGACTSHAFTFLLANPDWGHFPRDWVLRPY